MRSISLKFCRPSIFYYIDYFNPRLDCPNQHFCTTQGNIDIVVYPDTPRIHLRIHLKIDYKCWYTTIIIIRYTRYTTFDLWLKILHRGLEYLYSRFFNSNALMLLATPACCYIFVGLDGRIRWFRQTNTVQSARYITHFLLSFRAWRETEAPFFRCPLSVFHIYCRQIGGTMK